MTHEDENKPATRKQTDEVQNILTSIYAQDAEKLGVLTRIHRTIIILGVIGVVLAIWGITR